jgi:fructose-bisphosphate aldolase class II
MEGRFGQVGGSDGAKLGEYGRHTRMDPARAACFAASTEVDLLSFSAQPPRYTAPAHAAGLDFDAIAQLCDALPVPLALHDIAGVPEDQLSKGIRLGIVKLEVVPGAGSPYAHAVRTLLRGERRGASVEPERAALTVAVAQLLAVMS